MYFIPQTAQLIFGGLNINNNQCFTFTFMYLGFKDLGPYSQNFLIQIRKIFVTFGPQYLENFKTKRVSQQQLSLEVDVTYNKSNKMSISYV